MCILVILSAVWLWRAGFGSRCLSTSFWRTPHHRHSPCLPATDMSASALLGCALSRNEASGCCRGQTCQDGDWGQEASVTGATPQNKSLGSQEGRTAPSPSLFFSLFKMCSYLFLPGLFLTYYYFYLEGREAGHVCDLTMK